ncbi:hypothetical protein BC826DRAFT_1106537 [Russula brevipes]|nr:hypothetical protein BC826DRAFT_1106537 [Russula brevipes]
MTDPAARQGLDNNDLHIHARQRPPDSVRELVLPPSERPGYNLLYTTADTLNIDVLLTIFNHYRLDDEERWNTQLRWCKLSHVCRKWRYLIYGSSLHLNIFIRVTKDTPSLHNLAHLPSIPLIIDYRDTPSYVLVPLEPRRVATRYWNADTTEDDDGVLHAIQQRDRVRRIALEVKPSTLVKLIAPMDEPFPRLEALSLFSIENPGRDAMLMPTLPREFSAPNLRHLELRGIHLSRGISFLASALFLVTLKLTEIQSPGYFAPEDLVTQLQHIPKLEELSIGFSVPMNRASTEREPARAQTTVTRFPLSSGSVPLLERLKITLLYEPSFHIPHLSELIKATKGLGKPVAHVIFYDRGGASFVVGSRDELGDRSLKLEIRCNPFDQQVQSVARLCSAFVPDLPSQTSRSTLANTICNGTSRLPSAAWCGVGSFGHSKRAEASHSQSAARGATF